tara:strand:- start:5 stop:1270 length:1266 start_codon:yes stop_codon:yes gene_type:complete
MRFEHPAHPGRAVRLAYCMNLHAGDDLDAIRSGIREVTLPLRDRLAKGKTFGVGAYLPEPVATRLGSDPGAADGFATWLADEGLDAFTFNAFPFGGFHRPGLKERVYAPDWRDTERLRYTREVARAARAIDARRADRRGHISISTHPGSYGAWVDGPQDLTACAEEMGAMVQELQVIARSGGPEIVLSLEAEPRASAGDTIELAEFLTVARIRIAKRLVEVGLSKTDADAAASRHLGTCLDACHAAVQFEDPEQAVARSRFGGRLGKIQFSSALELVDPEAHPRGVAALLALDEPVYLHQVCGRLSSGEKELCADLPNLAGDLELGRGHWLDCTAWRCHFHVPVDLDTFEGLGTTHDHAGQLLNAALADPAKWGTDELHVEIETYTWGVLPGHDQGDRVEGLEREYAHVIGLLQAAGWNLA